MEPGRAADLLNKVVTILGTGVIAAELARRCKAMESWSMASAARPVRLKEFDKMFSRAELATAAALTDFLGAAGATIRSNARHRRSKCAAGDEAVGIPDQRSAW